MAHANREFDKTSLTIDTAEERILIHRDYLAHTLRWTHVAKCLMAKKSYHKSRVLDIGCGKEFPLAKMMYSNRMTDSSYVGVDLNSLALPPMLQKAKESGAMRIHVKPKFDVTKMTMDDLPWYRTDALTQVKTKISPTHIVCFEVFEHMHPRHAVTMLKRIWEVMDNDTTLFFSTPCYNGKAAANHINETTYHAMAAILLDNGFWIKDCFGTFASIADYRGHMNREQIEMFNRLREYYDTNLLAILWAPLFPENSRNCIWICKKKERPKQGTLWTVPEPWSQHQEWRMFNDV